MLAEKPLFFFKKDGGKVRVSYDGQVLPMQYDEVFRWGCCGGEGFDPTSNHWMAYFYGKRDGHWHYVEMGVYS